MKILFVVFIFSLLLGWRFYSFYQEKPAYKNGDVMKVRYVLSEEPDLTNKGQKFSVKDGFNQTIYVTVPSFPRLHYGEVVLISGKVRVKDLEDGRVLLSLYNPRTRLVAHDSGWVAGLANSIRVQSESVFNKTLPPTSSALLMGIVFGAKEHFSDSFFNDLKVTGVLHVIAASGMNVTFVSAALLFGLSYFFPRKVALVVGCFGIIFYMFLVGFQPSIIRASLMGIFAFGAGLLGRQHIAFYAALVSGYMMLLLQPGYLFDVGFQLSFLATLGIIFINPLIPLPQNIVTESFTTTTSAQLGTLPILLGTFGQFGLLSLLVNALVLWTVPVLMLFGSLAAVLSFVFVPIAQLLCLLCLPFLLFFEYVISFFGGLGFVISIPHVPWIIWFGYYFILSALILYKKPKLQEQKMSLLGGV